VTWTVVAACRQRAAGRSRARCAGLSRAGSGSQRSALVTGLGLAGRGVEAFRRLYASLRQEFRA